MLAGWGNGIYSGRESDMSHRVLSLKQPVLPEEILTINCSRLIAMQLSYSSANARPDELYVSRNSSADRLGNFGLN
jgi:hypothetical protein